MADYTAYDARVDSLVMEHRTLWDPAVSTTTEDERRRLAALAHARPEKAEQIAYDRTPTGFARTITITPATIARLRGL